MGDAVGNHGRERIARMERRSRNDSPSLCCSLSLCRSGNVPLYRVAQRPTLSSDVPRCNPPAKAEEKDEEEAEEVKEVDRDFLRWSWVWITTLYTDCPLLRQTIVGAVALETNYLQPRVRKLSRPRKKPAPPTKNACKREEKNEEVD